jgi:hypothetical protein
VNPSTDEFRPTLDYAPAARRRRGPLPIAAAIAFAVDLLGVPVAYFLLPAPLGVFVVYILIISATFFGLIVLVARRLDRAQRIIRRPILVTFDDDSVTCRQEDGGRSQNVRWSDLERVVIETTSAGPFADDVFWVLLGPSTGCVIPSEATGIEALIPRLQQLPNFDHRAVIEAMGCTADRSFLCWKRQSS